MPAGADLAQAVLSECLKLGVAACAVGIRTANTYMKLLRLPTFFAGSEHVKDALELSCVTAFAHVGVVKMLYGHIAVVVDGLLV